MDFIAGILEFIAIVFVGEKSRWGWAIGVLCCILWVIYVLHSKVAYGILIPTIATLIIDIRYFIRWTKDKKKCH